MSEFFDKIRELVKIGDVRISEHGYDELSADGISARDALSGVRDAVPVEEYPALGRGPAVLVLEYDRARRPIHVVWGIPAGHATPAVLVTAYRPNLTQWNEDYRTRRT